jgi:dephospho-CoA kinase
MRSAHIIGIGGTNGSGKDTIGQILADDHGYLFISVTELLRIEAVRRNQPVEREVLREISAEWRRELGLGVLIDKAVAEFETRKVGFKGLVIASLRNPGEVVRVHDMGGLVVWVDADPQTRYDRIQLNKASRGRSEEDNKSFEQFIAEENFEMHTPVGGDSSNLNSSGVKDLSDIFIGNDVSNIDSLKEAIKTRVLA